MPAEVIVGLQWGDEGKAKILDALAGDADIIVRYQGGSNAGHTVIVDRMRYAFHLIPAGIVRYGKICVIANGVVIDPGLLVKEIRKLERRGIKFQSRLKISDRAHLVMPYHRLLEDLSEDGGQRKLGTTRRGIGPCYSDKMARVGVRVCDMYQREILQERVALRVDEINRQLSTFLRPAAVRKRIAHVNQSIGWKCGERRLDAGRIVRRTIRIGRELEPFVEDTMDYLNKALDRGKRILFEGAQASMLDIDFGTYPYVTSSNSTSCGASSGSGVAPTRIDRALGILKAYTTRVGEGPFPTELTGARGERLREKGGEYGTTTGRPRRCGWLDLVAARFAVQINDIREIAVTKLDVLSGMGDLELCNAYRQGRRTITRFPNDLRTLQECEPVYETFPGWSESLTSCRRRGELPRNARRYLSRIEAILSVKIQIASVGGDRDQTIFLRKGRFC